MSRSVLLCVALVLSNPLPGLAAEGGQRLFAEDDGVWVLFFDVPSRRFRSARDALIRRDHDAARRDLETSAAHLRLEASRGDGALAAALLETASDIEGAAASIDQQEVTVAVLDALFVRAHWLLAQDYLAWAERSRDSNRHSEAGAYLWATVHHLERTVLWSNGRVDEQLENTLDGLRTMANLLRNSQNPRTVYRRKPIVQARRILTELGARMGLTVLVRDAAVLD